eukprot:g381.t1
MSSASDWKTLVDPRSNKLYYVNMLTKKTTWTNPFAPQTKDWVQYTDAKGRNYYMNKLARTSTWSKPAGFDEDALEYATLKEKKKAPVKDAKVWTKHIDPTTKFPYWTDAEGNMSTIDPTLMDEKAIVKEAADGGGAAADPDEEEVWTVPLTTKHADNATQKERIDTLMKKIEGGVVKDIAEITDFSAKKLQEHIDSIQSIVSRKRTSYFIEKSLAFIEEIVERKEAHVLRAMSDTYAMRTFMSVLALPRKPSTVDLLLRVLLKASANHKDFAKRLRLEGQFWDTLFNCIKIASGNDAYCFVEVYTNDEARDIPTPRHSSKQKVDAYNEAAKNSIGEDLTEADTASMNEAAKNSLKLLDLFLAEDPMVITFVREYGGVKDLVECCRSHDPHVNAAATAVLNRFVDGSGKGEKLRPLVEGQYSMDELLAMIHSKSQKLVSAALESLLRRIKIAAFPPLDEMHEEGSVVLREGLHIVGKILGRKLDRVRVAVAIGSDDCLYVYELSSSSPLLKLGLSSSVSVKGDHTGLEVRQVGSNLVDFKLVISKPTADTSASLDEFLTRIKDASKRGKFAKMLKPVSSFGAAALQSVRVRSRRKRQARRDRERKSKADLAAAVPTLGKAPPRHRGMTRSISRLKQPIGPSSSQLPPAFDVQAVDAAPSFGLPIVNLDLNIAIRWSDIGPQVPQLLFFAKKFSAFSGRMKHAVAALRCVEVAPSSAGSVRTLSEARVAIVTEDEYEFLDSLAAVVKNARAVVREEKSGNAEADEVMAHVIRCVLVVLGASHSSGSSKQLTGVAKTLDRTLRDKGGDTKRGLGDLLARVATSGNGLYLLTTLLCAKKLWTAGHVDPLHDSKMTDGELARAVETAVKATESACTKRAITKAAEDLARGGGDGGAEAGKAGDVKRRRSKQKSCVVM